jgi:ADP-heptose:LPS heptosyltransferase
MDELNKILVFRTDRLGDFILSKSVLNNLIQAKKFSIDIVVSEKNYDYIKNFNSFNKIFIYRKSFLKFIIEYKNILLTKYDYILIHDGKRRSHLISLFLKGKKFSLIKYSKSQIYFSFIKIFGFSTYYNSENNLLYDNLQFLNLLINENNKVKDDNFYFDYNFDKSFHLNTRKYCVFHLDEKWFKNYYYKDFTYPDWTFKFFNQIVNILSKKFNLPILITTGNLEVDFINDLKDEYFTKKNENIFFHNEMKDNLILLKKLSFRQTEYILKVNSKFLISCEGGITHLSHNLKIKTFAFVQRERKNFYKHWTGHMSNVTLCERSNSENTLKILSNL